MRSAIWVNYTKRWVTHSESTTLVSNQRLKMIFRGCQGMVIVQWLQA